MIKLLLLSTALAAATLRDLTVPPERLPAGCRLAPSHSATSGDNRVSFTFWRGFPSNPWIGNDRKLTASIRELIDGPAVMPDGPPLGARESSRFLGQLADGVEEAYAAVYLQGDTQLIVVRALRFSPTEKRRSPTNIGLPRIEFGQITAVISGAGDCYEAVRAYLKSLEN